MCCMREAENTYVNTHYNEAGLLTEQLPSGENIFFLLETFYTKSSGHRYVVVEVD